MRLMENSTWRVERDQRVRINKDAHQGHDCLILTSGRPHFCVNVTHRLGSVVSRHLPQHICILSSRQDIYDMIATASRKLTLHKKVKFHSSKKSFSHLDIFLQFELLSLVVLVE